MFESDSVVIIDLLGDLAHFGQDLPQKDTLKSLVVDDEVSKVETVE